MCPFCGSEKGYYITERVIRDLLFDYNDEPCGASEDITEFCSRRRRFRYKAMQIRLREAFLSVSFDWRRISYKNMQPV